MIQMSLLHSIYSIEILFHCVSTCDTYVTCTMYLDSVGCNFDHSDEDPDSLQHAALKRSGNVDSPQIHQRVNVGTLGTGWNRN
jgi:hypothetical protein